MKNKRWYQSKTMWVNFIALVGAFFNAKYGYELTMEQTTAVLAIINMCLRFITKKSII